MPAYNFIIVDAYTSRSFKKRVAKYTPLIGEDYQLTFKYKVMGQPLGDYYVTFDLANLNKNVLVSKSKTGLQTITHNFGRIPLDGEIPWQIQVDPFSTAGGADPNKSPAKPKIPDLSTGGLVNKSSKQSDLEITTKKNITGILRPQAPANSVDYFETVRIKGSQQINITFKPKGQISKMALMMAQPATASWQAMASSSCTANVSGIYNEEVKPLLATADRFWPLYFWEIEKVAAKSTVFKQDFIVEVNNQRVNGSNLRKATWAKLEALEGNDFTYYTQPESVIESNNAKITNFVKQVLGAKYRTKLQPYDAARQIFQAIVKHVTYTFPENGAEDMRGHTSVEVLDKKRGDCGGFSLLIVGCLRNMGIPARTACGFWIGASAHCWCEFYLPGHGWILCDGSASKSWSEYGEYAYCFGNQFDLNSRIAFMRGNTFKVGEYETSWLQGPAGPWLTGTAQTEEVLHKHIVEEVPTYKVKRLVTNSSGKRIRKMAFQCPCEARGGFRLDNAALKSHHE